MRIRHLASVTLLAALAACSTDSILEIPPETAVPEDIAIADPVSARSAVAGLYDALQGGSYYGEAFYTFGDLSSDNALHTGTFSTYSQADRNQLQADNSSIAGMWTAIYRSINRANLIITRLDAVTYLSQDTREQYLSEAYFVRALGHHNLTKLWGDVPISTVPISVPSEAALAKRSPAAEVYAQILSDLQKAEQLSHVNRSGTSVSLGAIRALRARVHLYRRDWAAAELAANSVIGMGYSLAPTYASLFGATGNATAEDIFRVAFSDQDAGSVSYYYMAKSLGGRRELGPTSNLRSAYEAGDARRAYSIANETATRFYVSKYPSVTGTEHIHVIRLAEVLLIKAEAQAQQGRLAEAIATLNPLRIRAGLAPLAASSASLATQTQVLDAISRERRVELAFEGDRFADLIRTGRAVTVLALTDRPHQALFPIPQGERDVAPNLTQNPGY